QQFAAQRRIVRVLRAMDGTAQVRYGESALIVDGEDATQARLYPVDVEEEARRTPGRQRRGAPLPGAVNLDVHELDLPLSAPIRPIGQLLESPLFDGL